MNIKITTEGGENLDEVANLAISLLKRSDIESVKFKFNGKKYKFKKNVDFIKYRVRYPHINFDTN